MIVIPMAGLSSRFFKAGFNKPKYMLDAHGISLFDHAVKSFEKYFNNEKFLFIVRDVYQTPEFVKKRVDALGIKNSEIIIIDKETRGQAETVFLGLDLSECNENETLTIFNIDTFRPNFIFPEKNKIDDGYLEVFKGTGDNWSFVKPENCNSKKVIETTEKKPISDLCCTGLYYFSSISLFKEAYEEYVSLPEECWEKGELYVAPLYNYLIKKGKEITYNEISLNDVIFCGVPDEYFDFIKS
ncbi:glycosyltransferase family 2 protein [Photobacterium leiognathi]|uniref:glycosyltransferase family 2 protein n=1 Tax=Photobacterium leiognathi TaxID=553611 RepID=UPI00298116E9|nr:glycosyltransferase family 2 protein [Photobacterium leiognathi]